MKTKAHINIAATSKGTPDLHSQLDVAFAKAVADLKLKDTLYSLSQRSIQVLRKIYFEDMSYHEIATEMGISTATVSNLRAQGLRLLNKTINFEYINT